jgi:hypothetical protein
MSPRRKLFIEKLLGRFDDRRKCRTSAVLKAILFIRIIPEFSRHHLVQLASGCFQGLGRVGCHFESLLDRFGLGNQFRIERGSDQISSFLRRLQKQYVLAVADSKSLDLNRFFMSGKEKGDGRTGTLSFAQIVPRRLLQSRRVCAKIRSEGSPVSLRFERDSSRGYQAHRG